MPALLRDTCCVIRVVWQAVAESEGARRDGQLQQLEHRLAHARKQLEVAERQVACVRVRALATTCTLARTHARTHTHTHTHTRAHTHTHAHTHTQSLARSLSTAQARTLSLLARSHALALERKAAANMTSARAACCVWRQAKEWRARCAQRDKESAFLRQSLRKASGSADTTAEGDVASQSLFSSNSSQLAGRDARGGGGRGVLGVRGASPQESNYSPPGSVPGVSSGGAASKWLNKHESSLSSSRSSAVAAQSVGSSPVS